MSDNPYALARPPAVMESGVESLDLSQCWRLLASNDLARLAVVDNLGADIFPINYLVKDEQVFFRSAPGSKIVSLTENPAVALEIDGTEERKRWSVVVRGEAHRLNYDADIEESGVQRLHTMPNSQKWNYFRISPRSVTGIRFRSARRSARSSPGTT
ncbi:pyridoxamine 5'-phosphate oxidase family protein [Mycetocola miduiensis]|uniref:Pyridoxamine 5'-phosphate oxidase n=1 Tax=Mycetocola miduiensis TaxID=995034 RepID=A0A1I4ZXW3_9MICO|nr:pyridoxamine 5'-phosphate oxidase family protein [Mycetocola miduiensis]SFN55035.1 hypothetical protein SAMN05216219_1171 [Mycetocola miduiensis]